MKHVSKLWPICLIVIGLVCSGCSSTLQEENKALVRRVMVEIDADDWEAASKLHSPDFIYHGPHESMTGTREELGQEIASFQSAFPDFRREINDMVAEGDKVAFRMTGSGTYNNKPSVIKEAYFARFDNGKIVEFHNIFHILD